MAFALRDRSRQDEYANYEQQSPNRQVNYRQVNYSQNYMQQDAYDNYQYAQGYAAPQQEYQQPQQQPQYMGNYRTQATQFVNNGFSAPQYAPQNSSQYAPQYGDSNFGAMQEQSMSNVQFGQTYMIRSDRSSRTKLGKKNINKDMIKIIVTIMVVALVICSLLIANQFISVNQAQAEEDVQTIDSDLLSSVVTEDGSYVTANNVTLIPEYEYETSTNWFDRFCDSLGLKLK